MDSPTSGEPSPRSQCLLPAPEEDPHSTITVGRFGLGTRALLVFDLRHQSFTMAHLHHWEVHRPALNRTQSSTSNSHAGKSLHVLLDPLPDLLRLVDEAQSFEDERELKRQRRKQSNRESARRSRLRKQAECDELAQRAEALKDENSTLRSEVSRIRSEYEQLLSENASLKERLGEVPGHEDLRPGRSDQHLSNDTNQIAQTEPHGGH